MSDRQHARNRPTLPAGYQFPTPERCDHDYRCRTVEGGYRAICNKCGHDAGVVDFTHFGPVLFGCRILNP